MENLEELIRALVRLPTETSWVEFKHNFYDAQMIGERICGLANAAAADALDPLAGNRYMKYTPYWA